MNLERRDDDSQILIVQSRPSEIQNRIVGSRYVELKKKTYAKAKYPCQICSNDSWSHAQSLYFEAHLEDRRTRLSGSCSLDICWNADELLLSAY